VYKGTIDMDAKDTQPQQESSFTRLTFTIIGFTALLAISMTAANRQTIMANWRERRCELPIVLSAALYKPADYNGSALQFSGDNFNFCMSNFAQMSLRTATKPAADVMQKQVNSVETVGQLQNSVRNMMGNLYKDFASIIDQFYNRYRAGQGQALRIFQYLKSATSRMDGIMGAAQYITATVLTGILNLFDLVFWIVFAISMILIVLYMIPFTKFLVLPFMFIITPTSWAGILFGYQRFWAPYLIFCFAENTSIVLQDGSLTAVQNLVAGQTLWDGNVVEGMFVFDGSKTPLYNLDGTLVSGTHLVYHEASGTYMEVASHPDAILTEITSEKVYCPITSKRHVFTKGESGRVVRFCDWEEVSTDAASEAWARKVHEVLKIQGSIDIQDMPAGFDGNSVEVYTNSAIWKKISEISIGDRIFDGTLNNNKWTQVLGIVKRQGLCKGISAGTWYMSDNDNWKQLYETSDEKNNKDIYHLITNSGTFTVMYDGKKIRVRDATEVGIENLRSLTPTVLQELNK
jgi:hypothetical protein